MHVAVNNRSFEYINALLVSMLRGLECLRCSTSGAFDIPKTKTVRQLKILVAGPVAWNKLPTNLTCTADINNTTLWLLSRFFCNFHLAPNTFFTLCHLAPNCFFSFSFLASNRFWPSTFLSTVWFYFMKKYWSCVKVLYIFFLWRIKFSTRWWKKHLDSTNSTSYKNSWKHF